MSWLGRIAQPVIRAYSVRRGVRVGRRVHIGLGSVLWAPSSMIVCDDVYVGKGCTIECDGSIGRGSMIGNRVGLIGRRDHDVWQEGVLVRHAPWIGGRAWQKTLR
jgi:UDP-3-O-[3-hydroxymyristoyl] glucosamine N-acyltransferase